MDDKKTEKIAQYNELTELLTIENDYLQILKGYCENEMEKSEVVARAYMISEKICSMHKELYDKIDNLIINLGI